MTIDLKSQLLLLKSLQDIDVSLRKIETDIENMPNKIKEAGADFTSASELVTSKQAEKAAIEKQRRDEEKELEVKLEHIKDREIKLYAIKTNKEYQAAIKEVADAKQANRGREELIMQLMEKIEGLGKEITQLSGGLADKEKAFREREAELKKDETSLLAEAEGKRVLRKDVEAKLDADMLRKYRYVQGRFSDALAVAASGTCTGCSKKIPPQVYIELQKWKDLVECPHCHRILFFEERVATEEGG